MFPVFRIKPNVARKLEWPQKSWLYSILYSIVIGIIVSAIIIVIVSPVVLLICLCTCVFPSTTKKSLIHVSCSELWLIFVSFIHSFMQVGLIFGYFPKDFIQVVHEYIKEELKVPADVSCKFFFVFCWFSIIIWLINSLVINYSKFSLSIVDRSFTFIGNNV